MALRGWCNSLATIQHLLTSGSLGLRLLKMNDPHVVSLTDRIEHADMVDFHRAPPRTVDRGVYRVTIDNYVANIMADRGEMPLTVFAAAPQGLNLVKESVPC